MKKLPAPKRPNPNSPKGVFVPCRTGVIYTVAPKVLGAMTTCPTATRKLQRMHGVKVVQHEQYGCTVVFPVLGFADVVRTLNHKPPVRRPGTVAVAVSRGRIW